MMLNERKKILGKPKPKGFGLDEPSAQLGPVNQEAERIIRGMKNQSAKRDLEVSIANVTRSHDPNSK